MGLQDEGMIPTSSTRHVQSVETGFEIIQEVQNQDGATLSTLADRVGLAKSTVHNYLRTLESMGYVVNNGGTYRLGLRFLTHGMAVKTGFELKHVVGDLIENIANDLDLATWWISEELGRGYFLQGAIPDSKRRIYGRIGKRSYLHTHAPGLAILATLPDDYVDEIIEYHGLPVHTTETVTDPNVLRDRLSTIRSTGYALSDGEAALGIQSVGTSFEDHRGQNHGIGVFGHSRDFGGEVLADEIGTYLHIETESLVDTLESEGFD